MKPVITMALVMLFSTSLITNASAGTVTTTKTKTTTTVTTSKYNCTTTKHKVKHHKRHRVAYHRCVSYDCYPDFADWSQCPSGAYDCYYDLQGVTYKQHYYPIVYENNTAYSCLANEGAESCS